MIRFVFLRKSADASITFIAILSWLNPQQTNRAKMQPIKKNTIDAAKYARSSFSVN